jgi:Bacterial antitoxin of type II TA system, VapB
MVGNMKTTVTLPDSLLKEAQDLARREGTTLRALIEAGLRSVVNERSAAATFELADASVGGRGLQPDFRNASWDQIREAVYDHQSGTS